MKYAVLPAAVFLLLASAAYAEPGGVSSVSGPGVSKGQTEFEARAAYFDGGALDGRWQYRAQAGHGFTDFWQATLILRATDPTNDSAELTSIGIENRIDFTATRDWPVHLGAQVEYKFGLNGGDDEIDFKLLAERSFGPINTRLNLNASRELTDGADWEPSYGARAHWRANDRFSFGVEAFGEPEIDAHYIGPRANMNLGNATLSIGYLVGYDEAAADGQIRFVLEIEP